MKILKLLKKIQIKPIYIILGLLAIVLIVSALGSTKEGMTSSEYTELKKYQTKKKDTLDQIYSFVDKQQKNGWDSSNNFIDNLNGYVNIYTQYSKQQFLKTHDINNDGKVVVKKDSNTYVRDNSNNYVNSDEKLFYYDLKSQDITNDGLIVAYKNSDSGNFYRDNSGNEVFGSDSPYILQSIGTNNNITQTTVDNAMALLTTHINRLTNNDDKNTINNLISELKNTIDKIVNITMIKSASEILSHSYNPNDVQADGFILGGDRIRTRERDRMHVNDPNYWSNLYNSDFNRLSSEGFSSGSNSSVSSTNTVRPDLTGVGTCANGVAGANGVGANGVGANGQSNIAPGNEDLYMLKTQMLPPNCPVGGCGTAASVPNNIRPAAVPPCPPCERCPEPSFECKKVPRYASASNNQYLPRPVLADFSQFGM